MGEQLAGKKTLFLSAIELPTREQRREFLDEACGDNPQLREEVESLLDAHDRLPAIDTADATDEPVNDAQAGSIIGCYKLLETIGEGGMAVVFLAEQMQPIQRKVALKLIRPGMDSRQVIARFEAERQALALMDHPNIAKVLDAGTTDRGQPYFVMELVKGVAITKYCDENHLSPRDRLELFVQVCQAVQHAHQKGIIHRDIKPSNVLIALYDGRPVPKVIDFGIAKAMGQQLVERTMFTGFGAIIGTLEYMSPEQAELNQLDIDTRSDIYSLGVLLYELLTGTTPLQHERLKRTALDEVLRTIRQEEPPKPSTRLSTMSEAVGSIAAQRALDPKKLTAVVRGELDWIVMKALEKDRSRRYDTANGLAMDIARYLHDETVLACPPSASYRLRKFARRHVTALLATAGVFAGLVVLVVVLSISNVRVARERNDKAAALRDAQAQRERAEKNFLNARTAVAKLMAQPASAMGEWKTMPRPLRKKFADEAVKYYNNLLAEGTADRSLQYETAVGYRSIGFLSYKFSEYPEAEKLARQSLEILERLNQQDPKNRDYRQQLAWSRMLLGWVFSFTNRTAEAEAAFRQSAGLLEKLLSEVPKHQSYSNELGECYVNLARVCEKQWAALDDEQFKERALSLPASLPADLPHTCLIYDRVGAALGERGLIDDAVVMHREALARLEKMADYPITEQLDLIRLHFHEALADTLITGKRSKEAIALIERDVATFPDDALVYATLGHIRARMGQWDQAAADFGKSLYLQPTDPDPWYCAAAVYLARGDTESYRRACAGMLEQFGKPNSPVGAVERTIKACAAVPDAVSDFAAVERLAERLINAAEQNEPSRAHMLAKGLVECRAGHWAQAVEWLGRVAPDPQGTFLDATAFSALAIAKQQLGDQSAAQSALGRAQAIVAQKMPDPAKGQVFVGSTYVDWLHCQALCREAEKLLKGPTGHTTQPLDTRGKT